MINAKGSYFIFHIYKLYKYSILGITAIDPKQRERK